MLSINTSTPKPEKKKKGNRLRSLIWTQGSRGFRGPNGHYLFSPNLVKYDQWSHAKRSHGCVLQSILLEARVLPRAVVGLLEQPARLASWDSGAMKNKPIVEYFEHMVCPPTASREETKRNKMNLFTSLIGHSVLALLCACVCNECGCEGQWEEKGRNVTLHK